MWTKKFKINEIQSNILMYGEICGKEEIREISNREVIFSDRLLAYAGWHAACHGTCAGIYNPSHLHYEANC